MDDINDIKARFEGAQAWKLFRASYREQFPDDSLDLDNEPPETLIEKLKEKGYENPNELLGFREDFKAEQNFFQGRSEEKTPDEGSEKKAKEKTEHRHRQPHAHLLTYDEFEKEADKEAQEASDEWDKTKDESKAKDRQDAFRKAKQDKYDKLASEQLSTAQAWHEKLIKDKKNNEHLEAAIKKEVERRSKNPSAPKNVSANTEPNITNESLLGPTKSPGQVIEQPKQTQVSQSIRPSISWAPRRPSITSSSKPRWVGAGKNRAARNLTRAAAKTVEKIAARAIKREGIGLFAAATSEIWIPLLVIGLFILLLLIILAILLFGIGGATAKPANLPEGINYYIIAPPNVENGQDINYQIYFTYDSSDSNVPDLNTISIVDSIPPEASFKSATDPHVCDPECDETAVSVTWKISDFKPQSVNGSVSNYKFEVVLHPNENDVVVVNDLCIGIGSDPLICPGSSDQTAGGDTGENCTAGTTDTCGGAYNISKNPDGVNFGDPYCELASNGSVNKLFVASEIKRQLLERGKVKDYCRWTCIAANESHYNPNSYNGNASRPNLGAWGMFQFLPYACYDPTNNPKNYSRAGNVPWRDQISRAMNYQYNYLTPWQTGVKTVGYWSTYKWTCYKEPDWNPGVKCLSNDGIN